MKEKKRIIKLIPDLEIRRFATIYNTFIKMNLGQQGRALTFLNHKFNSLVKQKGKP